MHSTTVYLNDEQKDFFKDRHKKLSIPVAVQMREAFDLYMNIVQKKEMKKDE